MKRIAAVVLFAVIALPTFGEGTRLSPATEALLKKVAQKIATWGRDPVLVDFVRMENAKHRDLAVLKSTEKSWEAGGEQKLAAELMTSPCADRLRQLISGGAFSEPFVMDEQGANACIVNRTTYFWRGEMPKFLKAYNAGGGAIFIGEPQWDASAKTNLVQISVPVMDATKAIGVLTVGVNANALARDKK